MTGGTAHCCCSPSLALQLRQQPYKQPSVISVNKVKSAEVLLCCLELRLLTGSESLMGQKRSESSSWAVLTSAES